MNYGNLTEEEFKNYIESLSSSLPKHEINKIKRYRDLFILYLNIDGGIFQYLSEEERDDEELLLASIKETAYVFQYASERLRDDEKTVEKCITKKGSLLSFASTRLKNNRRFVEMALNNSSFAYKNLNDNFRDDEELFWIAAKDSTYVYAYASPRIKEDFQIIKKMTEINFYFLLDLDNFAHKKEWIYYIYEHNKFKQIDTRDVRMSNLIERVKSIYHSFKREDELYGKLTPKNTFENTKSKI